MNPQQPPSAVHYPVWFNLKPGQAEAEGLHVIRQFRHGLCSTEAVEGFELLRNRSPSRSRLPAYHALLRFATLGHLDQAMRQQTTQGIRSGGHGAAMEVVSDFQVEIFEALTIP